jgi:prepilin-type processing-associated H-X9-DG protein
MSNRLDPYDASDVEERPRSGYLTKKDIRAGAVVLVILALISTPVWMYLKRQTQKAICAQNFQSIYGALGAYMAQNDEHFPPICAQGDNLEPALLNGKPITWATVISGDMSKRASFRCPSATDAEVVHAVDPASAKGDLPMTYGMYSPWSTASTEAIANTHTAIVIAETSNFGSEETYDPVPFKNRSGNVVRQDGFFIGWDKGNYVPDWQRTASAAPDMPRNVTRLAFFGTSRGDFHGDVRGRHDGKIHVLFVDGHLGSIGPTAAAVSFTDVGALTGRWTTQGWVGGP